METKAILVKKTDWSYIKNKKDEMEVSSHSKVVNLLVRFYEKHKEVEPDFK